jgi:hypothetical protein
LRCSFCLQCHCQLIADTLSFALQPRRELLDQLLCFDCAVGVTAVLAVEATVAGEAEQDGSCCGELCVDGFNRQRGKMY